MKTLIKLNRSKVPVLCFLAFLLLTTTAVAQGDLLIFPKRLVFEGTKKRSATLNLSNTGKDTARYDISFVQVRMTENGGFENITDPDPGQLFADPYLRHFPRRVVLAPNESQVVKIQMTRTNELEPGEYRSHIYFRSVPDAKPLGEKPKETDTTTLFIRLTPVYGITIPCIIRIGEPTTQVDISSLSLGKVEEQPVIVLNFKRTGNMSPYGDIIVTHTSHKGKKTKVAEIKGFAVYTPGNQRKAQIALKANGVDYRNGKLSVVYINQEKGSKKITFAEAELVLF